MGQEIAEAMKEQRIASIIAQASKQLGLQNPKRFSGGHMGVPLFMCEGDNGVKRVAKFGISDETNDEVRNNYHGYAEIKATGATSILPGNIMFADIDGSPFLVMDNVGMSFAESVKGGDIAFYSQFISGIEKVYDSALHRNEKDLHATGVRQIRDEVALWQRKLVDADYLPNEALDPIMNVDVLSIAGSHATLMLSDFTPDNVFVQDEQVKFIDPWRQETYLGTPIPGIAQFITLVADVYDLPGAAEMKGEFEALAYRVGEKLGLTKDQVENQLRLGKAMQLALSSYVRIDENDTLAKQFALASYDAIRAIK